VIRGWKNIVQHIIALSVHHLYCLNGKVKWCITLLVYTCIYWLKLMALRSFLAEH